MHTLSLLLGSTLLAATVAPATAQTTGAPAHEPAGHTDAAQDKPVDSSRALELQKRIHEMRKQVLLGGDKVHQAETEAIEFYNRQSGLVDQRIDSMETDLVTKRASYQVSIDEALQSSDPAKRAQATKTALGLSAEIAALEQDIQRMKARRTGVSKLVATVAARKRDRENMAIDLDTSSDLAGTGLGLPAMAVGFAPTGESSAGGSLFDDERVVEDLLARDPRAAKQMLFDADPKRYWERFTLQPPAGQLVKALPFPSPDVPGQR